MDTYQQIPDTVVPAMMSASLEKWHPRVKTTANLTVVWIAQSLRPVSSPQDSRGERPTFVEQAAPILAGLHRLRTFKDFGEGWDAEGGAAPNPRTIDTATKVFGLVSAYVVPQVTLNSSGFPMLIFDGRHRGEIVVTSPTTIDYFFDDKVAPFGDEVTFDESLPSDLIEYLQP